MNFNEDPIVDWEEFTTFCIQTDVAESFSSHTQVNKLDTYQIEYSENTQRHDTSLSSFAPLAVMKYIPNEKHILTIQETGNHQIILFNENFDRYSNINPLELSNYHNPLNTTTATEKIEKCKVYDCCYLLSKDYYVYCASDHTLVICKEHSTGKKIYYTIINKIYSSTSHVKLCWGDKTQILCSVDTENMIYGWDIECVDQPPLFQISRHQDLITDFIALDHLDLFLTCSLDKRIVMWSQSTRRVRGVLLGHKRGVRCMSYSKDILLTAGYECHARTWNLHSKELLYILSGHRHPIQIGKLMCPHSSSGLDQRAVTLDVSGEFRLWNCSVREKTSSQYAEVLQIFSLKIRDGGSDQIAKIRFLEFPYDPIHSIGVYSDIIAGSPGLIHLIPEKTINEFIPPTTICCSESSGFLITACGTSLYKYDLCSGLYHSTYPLIYNSEVTCSCGDGYYARRIFIGFTNGRLAIVNFTTGKIVESVMVNTRGISCICVFKSSGINLLYVGSPDGRISCIEDTSTGMNIHLTAEQVIGDNCGITRIIPVESLNLLVASSGGKCWGIWDSMTFRRLFLLEEEGIISDICLIGASGDKADVDERMSLGLSTIEPGHVLTVAVCLGAHINIYTGDSLHGKIAFTHRLIPQQLTDSLSPPSTSSSFSSPSSSFHSSPFPSSTSSLYLSAFTHLRAPDTKSLNYSTLTASSKSKHLKAGNLLVAASDEGFLFIWNIQHIRKDSKSKFKFLFPNLLEATRVHSVSEQESLRGTGNPPPLHDPNDLLHEDNYSDPTSHPHPIHPTFITYSGEEDGRAHLAGVAHQDLDHANHPSLHPHHSADTLHPDDPSHPNHRRFSSFYDMKRQFHRSREKVEIEMKLKKSQSMFQIELSNEEVAGYDSFVTEVSQLYFSGHSDMISCLLPLNDSGCILTASLDGFQRIWNMDTDCLGELPLPNLSEKLKSHSLFRHHTDETQTWKFILERIPITISHRDIARKLVLSILQPNHDHHVNGIISERDRRRATKNALLYGGATIADLLKLRNKSKMGVGGSRGGGGGGGEEEEDDVKSQARLQILTELCAPRPFDEEDNWRSLIPNDLNEMTMINSLYTQPTKSPMKDDQTIETGQSLLLSGDIKEGGVTANRPRTTASGQRGGGNGNTSRSGGQSSRRPSTAQTPSEHFLPSSLRKGTKSPAPQSLFPKTSYPSSSSPIQPQVLNPKTPQDAPMTIQINPTVSLIRQHSNGTIGVDNDEGQSEGVWKSSSATVTVATSTKKTNLWKTPTSMGCYEEAFSLSSISDSKRRGVINSEEFRTLNHINRDEDRVQAFNRQIPQFLLRNTNLSTRAAVPKLDEVSHAEMMFGNQKVCDPEMFLWSFLTLLLFCFSYLL
jgi:hypothetical protein